MGYEIKAYIGKTCRSFPEWKLTTTPYKDGSGFEPERDEQGAIVCTDRTEHPFMVYAMLDMCKLGYQDDPLNELISQSFQLAKDNSKDVHYFYGSDGNTTIKEDRYGATMHPVPLKELAEALNAMPNLEYRRLRWLKALVDSMVDDKEEMSVMFFGY